MAKTFKKRRIRKKYRSSKTSALIYLGITLAGVAAVALLFVFVIIPLGVELLSPLPTVRYTPATFKESVVVEEKPEVQEDDLSNLQHEAKISYATVNDPYLYGDSIVFSTASVVNGISVYDTLIVYNIKEEKEKRIVVDVKYENIINFVMNDDYIIWCDADSDNGGRICAYDRHTGEQFAIKDYVYASPDLSLSGDILCFMQQAGDSTDRLYLYNVREREALTYKVFSDLSSLPTPASIYNDEVVYAIPSDEGAGYAVYIVNIKTGSEKIIETGKKVYYPKTNGKDVAFLSSASGAPTDLYIIDGESPFLIDSEVVNFDVCDEGIVYTKDGAVYLYRKEDKRSIRINSSVTRAYLVHAEGNFVCWYDITGGYGGSDVVKYAILEG